MGRGEAGFGSTAAGLACTSADFGLTAAGCVEAGLCWAAAGLVFGEPGAADAEAVLTSAMIGLGTSAVELSSRAFFCFFSASF